MDNNILIINLEVSIMKYKYNTQKFYKIWFGPLNLENQCLPSVNDIINGIKEVCYI